MKRSILTLAFGLATWFSYAQKPSPALLEPTNHTLLLIDHQGQLAVTVHSISLNDLRNNVSIVAGASKIFNVPTVVTLISGSAFAGPVLPEIISVYPLPLVSEVPPEPAQGYFNRTSMNAWEDPDTYRSVTSKGKKKIVIAGLWTSVNALGPVLSALSEGYETYVITDACGDVSEEAHDQALIRMVQAGAKPITSLQYLLELQRDWSRQATARSVNEILVKYAGAYGPSIQYTREILQH